MKKSVGFLSAVLFFMVPFCVQAEDPTLAVKAFPDQRIVKAGMMFLVNVQVINQDKVFAGFWTNDCSYEKHWVTDHAGVLIQPWTCADNGMEEITLGNGAAYTKNIILYIPKPEKTGPVTFRLGFKRMSENGDVAEPIWSDPVTIRVLVPEGSSITEKPAADDAAPDSTAGIPAHRNAGGETDDTAKNVSEKSAVH